MSGYNTSRDELYLRLSPDCSSETITESNAVLSDELSEDEQLFYKYLAKFPRFEISNAILVSDATLRLFCIFVYVCFDFRTREHI